MPATKPTRVAADLLESAAAEGARQSRSATQQLDHWARVGRTMCVFGTVGIERVTAALAGTLPLYELNAAEALVANASLDATISQRASTLSFGPSLAAAGITTVALDRDGRLVRHHPDGTTSFVDDTAATPAT